jgi:hypothetical protein
MAIFNAINIIAALAQLRSWIARIIGTIDHHAKVRRWRRNMLRAMRSRSRQ